MPWHDQKLISSEQPMNRISQRLFLLSICLFSACTSHRVAPSNSSSSTSASASDATTRESASTRSSLLTPKMGPSYPDATHVLSRDEAYYVESPAQARSPDGV